MHCCLLFADTLFHTQGFSCALREHVPVMDAAGKPVTMQLSLASLVPFCALAAVALLRRGDPHIRGSDSRQEQVDWARTMSCVSAGFTSPWLLCAVGFSRAYVLLSTSDNM
jgi:hypothetical protein